MFAWNITLPPAGLTPNIVLAQIPDVRNNNNNTKNKTVLALCGFILRSLPEGPVKRLIVIPLITRQHKTYTASERVSERESELCIKTMHERTHAKAPKATSADLLGMHWPECNNNQLIVTLTEIVRSNTRRSRVAASQQPQQSAPDWIILYTHSCLSSASVNVA